MAFISFAVGVVLTGVFTYTLGKYVYDDIKSTPQERREQQEIQDFTELKSRIRMLNHTLDELEEVENLLTDVETCKPGEQHRYFHLCWNGNKKYSFLADGGNMTTDKLRELAEAEYQKLRSTLLEQIQDLQ